MKKQKIYICHYCGFKWSNMEKHYDSCPNCCSRKIKLIDDDKNFNQQLLSSFEHENTENCHCPKCGHEEVKISGLTCRHIKCPKCGTNLMGIGRCGFG